LKVKPFSKVPKKDVNLYESYVRILVTIGSVTFMILSITVQPMTLGSEYPFSLWLSLSVLPLIFAVASLFLSPWLHERKLQMEQLVEPDSELVNLVEETTRKQGLNRAPKIYLMNSKRPVCHVFGLRSRDARIVISEGLRELSSEEMESIISHEIAHIRNRDMWFLNWGKIFKKAMKYWAVAFLILAFSMSIIRDWTVDVWIDFSYRYLFLLLSWVIVPIISINSVSRVGESLADARASLSLGDCTHFMSAIRKISKSTYLDGLLTRLTRRKTARILWDFCRFAWVPRRVAKYTIMSSPPISERFTDLKRKRYVVGNKLLLPSKETSIYAGLFAVYFLICTSLLPFWGISQSPLEVTIILPLAIVLLLNTFALKYSSWQRLFEGPPDREYRSFLVGLFTRNLLSWGSFAFTIWLMFFSVRAIAYGELEVFALSGLLFLFVLYSLLSWLFSFLYLIFRRFITRS
jgi:Zn-dependent protease with chaperone function